MKKITISVPCFNEVNNARPMAETLIRIMDGMTNYTYEIIFTDNASEDGTQDVLRELAKEYQNVKVIINNRNYGMDGRSGRNTSKMASGDALIYIPCDFQEPPELIPEFIKYWEEGYKAVCGQKCGSKEGKIKFALRSLFYKIIDIFSDVSQYRNMSGITLTDREIMELILQIDMDVPLRFHLADMGYEVKLIPYVQQKRRSGKSTYNAWRYLTFAINAMVNTSTTPLRIATVTGVCMSAVSFLIGVIYLVLKLVAWNRFQAGTTPVLIGMFFLGAVQILFMGIVGEYVGLISRKVSKRPEAIVREFLNFDVDECEAE